MAIAPAPVRPRCSWPLAAVIAGLIWTGLVVQAAALVGRTGSVAAALLTMSAYFTVTTNLLLAVVCTGITLGRPAFEAPRVIAGVALAMVLVGIVYHLLLRGLLSLSGGDRVADWILHSAAPPLAALFWVACVRKGALTWRDPLLWALYPLGYVVYALVRGGATGRYPYPFLDVARLGWAVVASYAFAIAVGFLGAGAGVVWLDGRLARRNDRAEVVDRVTVR